MNWVIFIFSLIISAAAIYYGLKLSRLYFRVTSWTRVRAKILKKEIADRKLKSDRYTSKTLIAEYSYEFDGQSYTNNTVFMVHFLRGEKGFTPKHAQKLFDKIQNEVLIYVNPKEPSEAVMFCDGIAIYLLAIFIGILCFLIGLSEIIK